jgi:hypothetical protein
MISYFLYFLNLDVLGLFPGEPRAKLSVLIIGTILGFKLSDESDESLSILGWISLFLTSPICDRRLSDFTLNFFEDFLGDFWLDFFSVFFDFSSFCSDSDFDFDELILLRELSRLIPCFPSTFDTSSEV